MPPYLSDTLVRFTSILISHVRPSPEAPCPVTSLKGTGAHTALGAQEGTGFLELLSDILPYPALVTRRQAAPLLPQGRLGISPQAP